jgi:hypothetical protein
MKALPFTRSSVPPVYPLIVLLFDEYVIRHSKNQKRFAIFWGFFCIFYLVC